ncbi:MAG TPA: hypothetical protein VFN75_04245 [Pseudonocardiaceae bacterium]|nr:hypothetical protein [Pseudonocardiaceae bacterium]
MSCSHRLVAPQARWQSGESRAVREAVKINPEGVAGAFGWYRAKVGKVETGAVRLTGSELSSLLSYY